MLVIPIDGGERDTPHTTQLADQSLWIFSATDSGESAVELGCRMPGGCAERRSRFLCRSQSFVYRLEYTCSAEDVVRTTSSEAEVEREQLVRKHGLSDDANQYPETTMGSRTTVRFDRPTDGYAVRGSLVEGIKVVGGYLFLSDCLAVYNQPPHKRVS
jgi:hypothetical protein